MPRNSDRTPRNSDRKPVGRRSDPLDRAGVTYIDYKDTDLLRQFVSDRGRIRGRRATRVTSQQQRQLARAIKNAREMALLPHATR
ncbi:30S ribosomal protein S18 2 [Streptomyces ambofaciens ATCC 23877]|uniref:Small ribosomal subunit protein bS18 n=1 Tax=Streptomyces ambofaciens (strain ATCC 23877 / 3486 / DSM 40053 / JCM 4204 / NBRC 12836 / NRRL B-2516) TaxID=278992 RepID=A0A0K2AVM3_STRA7|nr:30S ribosomal protein S18 [Streptomyces ambofaciens]AKZ57185.1 30S ribosomal protein S18 2 [Streptomyces ambofaciens ATCC 23877]